MGEKEDKDKEGDKSRKEGDDGKSAGGPESESKKLDGDDENGEDSKQDEEARSLRQQQATLAVLSCFQKLSDVSLENYESLKKEFEEVLAKDLPHTGAQRDTLKEEAERVFAYAKQYIETLKDHDEDDKEEKTKKEDQKRDEDSDEKEDNNKQEEEKRRAEEKKQKEE